MPCPFGNGEALMPHIRGAARRNCIPTQRVGTRPLWPIASMKTVISCRLKYIFIGLLDIVIL